MPHVDDLLGYASAAAAALATVAVMSSACAKEQVASDARYAGPAIVRLQPVEVVAHRSVELARMQRDDVPHARPKAGA